MKQLQFPVYAIEIDGQGFMGIGDDVVDVGIAFSTEAKAVEFLGLMERPSFSRVTIHPLSLAAFRQYLVDMNDRHIDRFAFDPITKFDFNPVRTNDLLHAVQSLPIDDDVSG